MWALEAAAHHTEGSSRAVWLGAALGLGGGLVLGAALVAAGWRSVSALKVAAVTAGHGALLGASLGRTGRVTGRALVSLALLALGATGAAQGPGGAVAHLALPAWLGLMARGGRLAALGVSWPAPVVSVLAGFGLGAALGSHLLLSATLTLGYRARQDGLVAYLAALAYDVGANVPSSELFFRGLLFDHVQRRWSFVAGATVATAAYLLRFLLDPRLPGTTEAVFGGVVYLSLLSLGNCWLFWWSGSLIPALVGAFAFFAMYRTLAVG